MPSDKTIIVQNGMLVILSVIFSLFLGEVFLRIFSPIKLQAIANHSTKEWSDTRTFNAANFRPSVSLGYELEPHSLLGTNSLGMFDKERLKEKTEDLYRIICLGDSTTAYGGYTEIVEGLLNQDKKRKTFEVWNCGVPGYGAIQYYRALKEKWIKYNPDMVIIGFCLNDFDTTPLVIRESNNLVGYFPEREIMPQLNPVLLRYSGLYRFIAMRLLNTKKRDKNSDTAKLISYHLRDMKNLLEKEGIRFLVVIFGIVDRFDRYPAWTTNYGLIKNIIDEYSVESIDIVPLFKSYGEENLRLFPGDELHFNQKGARIIAEEIYNYLTKSLDIAGI